MRLKRLVCRGFKSFADKTEFEFDSRLTGIIGPNGCGKSNVVDAIKWVLGDQRAKSLRGSEMTDVIFKGAEGREAMGMAEVTITFEDEQGRIDGQTEVDIGRRLTLDKESSYLLNGGEVRLKDVRDVLMDTGLGVGAYSVMEQGRIDAVLSANPEARRAIFEEAAGISRFKLQKRETLRRLERTDQNLARVTDLLEERARRIRGLRVQAGKARRWEELTAALRDLRAALAVGDGRSLRAAIEQQRAALAELLQQVAGTETERSKAAAALAADDEVIRGAEAALAEAQAELHRCQSELSAQRERLLGQQQRAEEQRAEAARLQDRAAGLGPQRDERAVELETGRDALAQKEAELVDLHRELAAQRARVGEAQAAVRARVQQRDALRNGLLELLHARTRARNQAHDQEAKLGAARARDARLRERLQNLGAELGRMAAERTGHEADQRDRGTRERILSEREARALGDLKQADAAAAALAEREATLRRELSELEGRAQALQAMEAHFEGLDRAPVHVLQAAAQGLAPGLRGRLLDLLEIDLDHSAALEAALGPYVQALVVDTRQNAEAILSELRQARLGRVLLLVEEEFGADLEHVRCFDPPAGSQVLLDLVRQPEHASPSSRRLLAWLLRGVVLVPSLEHADPLRSDLCFVTPDGQLLCGPRLEGGAAAEGHAGLVVRRSQIHQLGADAEVVRGRMAGLQADKDQVEDRVAHLKRELRQLGEALGGVRRQLHDGEAQLARLRARAGDVEREQGELELEDAELRRLAAGALSALGRHLWNSHLIGRREAARQAEESELSAAIDAAQQALAEQVAAEQDLRLRQAQAGEAREGLVRGNRMREEALRELDRALAELRESAAKATATAERAAGEAARLQQEIGVFEDDAAQHAQVRDQKAAVLAEARGRRDGHQRALQDIESRRSTLTEQVSQARLQLSETEHRFLRLEDRLREETGVELRRCLGEVHGIGLEDPADYPGPVPEPGLVECLQGPPLPPDVVQAWYGLQRLWQRDDFDAAAARAEVQVLQSQRDRLGAVNLDAVQELQNEEGQLGTLEQEVVDLKEARRGLMETLRKLEQESRTLFDQTFQEARKNFQEIFRKLFQGGKADISLSEVPEGGDAMDAGIEIVAKPPGKELQSINLLSGGERSLTALAILFALFKVRPSPFCILDEVDAALDETNVERFLRVLREFTDSTQFCIVTHHKRTMAECQALYGITMQRRGISSRIAVSLQEVDGFQEGAAPGGGERSADPALKRRIAGEEAIGF